MKFNKKSFYWGAIFALVLCMNYKKFGEIAHEILGLILIFFALFHAFSRRKCLAKFRVRNALNFALLGSFLATFASAVFLSEHIFSFIDFGFGSDAAKNIHMFATHALFLLSATHLGLNFRIFANLLSVKFSKILKFCLFLALLAFGIYSFVDLHFYEYLFFKTGFGLENKNTFLFSSAEYLAIFAAVMLGVRAINLRFKF